MNLLDWNGPDFLALYVVLLIATTGAVSFMRRQMRSPFDDFPVDQIKLKPLEIAYLAGYEPRVVEAAVARLIRCSALRPGAIRHSLAVAGAVPQDAHAVEEAIYMAVSRHGDRRLVEVVEAAQPQIDQLAERLQRRGLLVSKSQAARARMLSLGLFAPLLLLGLAKAQVGWSRGAPVFFLIVLMIVAAVVAVSFYRRPLRRSGRGDKAIEALRIRHVARSRSAGGSGDDGDDEGPDGDQDAYVALGLFGAMAVSDERLDEARLAFAGAWESEGFGISDGGSSDSGSGDSGSSCGGGGCGGCGGGGD